MEGAREQEREEVDGFSMRATSLLAWTIWALSMALTMLSLWLLVLGLSRPNVPVYPYWVEGTLLAVGYSTVGTVVASRRPGNLVGWALCSIGLSWGRIISAASMSPTHCWQRPGRTPLLKLRPGSTRGFGFRVLGLLCFLVLLLPSGQLPSPRWRPFAWLSVLVAAVGTIVTVFSPGARFGLSVQPLPQARRAQPHAGGGTGQRAQTALAIPTGFRNSLPRL